MGKGANQQLLSNSGVAQSNSNQLYQAGGNIGGPLTATLENEANNPQGYTPQQLAYMDTASQQSLGGGATCLYRRSGFRGGENPQCRRIPGSSGNRRPFGAKTALAECTRNSEPAGEPTAAQKQQALSSLQSLYGVDEATALSYLDSSTSALKEENQGSQINTNDFWKDVQGTEQVAGMSGSGGG